MLGRLLKTAARQLSLWQARKAPAQEVDELLTVRRFDESRRPWIRSQQTGEMIRDAPETGFYTENARLAELPRREQSWIQRSVGFTEDLGSSEATVTKVRYNRDLVEDSPAGRVREGLLSVDYVDPASDARGTVSFDRRGPREHFGAEFEARFSDEGMSFREFENR